MADVEETALQKVDRLHAQEAREKDQAARLPEGPEKDKLRMHAERLSDEAWAIEEKSDVEFTPSGLWSNVDEVGRESQPE